MSSTELAVRPPENVWPPSNVKEFMAFFIEKEYTNPEFAGMSDCANDFIQKFYEVLGTSDEHILTKGNKTVPLTYQPDGYPGNKVAGEALMAAVYALSNAEMTDAHESSRHGYHVLYEGEVEVAKSGDTRRVPIAFSEIYTTDDSGKCVGMEWAMRTNYPLREQLEIQRIQQHPIASRANWSLRLVSEIEKLEETSEPDYPLQEAA